MASGLTPITSGIRLARLGNAIIGAILRPCSRDATCTTSYNMAFIVSGDASVKTVRSFASYRGSEQVHETNADTHHHEEQDIGSEASDKRSEDQLHPGFRVDLDYRSPTERVWPAARHQQRYAGRVRDALQTVMMFTDTNAYRDLTGRYGFTVVEVRMSPDNSTAYILWDAFPDRHDAAQRELNHRVSRLRRSLAQALKSRHVPRLEFRRDAPSGEELAVDEALHRLQNEM